MRDLRWIPEGGALVEITNRTLNSLFLLRPSAELNDIILGVLGRYQRIHYVRLSYFVVLSSHLHLLAWFETAQQMANFMRDVKSKIAKEIGRATGHREKIWGRSYRHHIVSNEPEVQIERLRYLLSQGVHENLVLHPVQWPGVKALDGWLDGGTMTGHWIDRTKQYKAAQRDDDRRDELFMEPETAVLSPLPCGSVLDRKEVQQKIEAMADEIEKEAIARHQAPGTVPLGSAAVLRASPFDSPTKINRSPTGRFHATGQHYARLCEAFKWFVNAFRDAADKLRQGLLHVRFPAGSFPPPRPVILATVDLAPD